MLAVGSKARRSRGGLKGSPSGSLNPCNDWVEMLRLLWVQRPGDRRGGLKGNPADADDARPVAGNDWVAALAVGLRAGRSQRVFEGKSS